MIRAPYSRSSRTGFTLIELLVVIAIMLVLVGLTVAGVMKFMDTGPRLATRSNLKNNIRAINSQWQAVAEKARRENMPPAVQQAIIAFFAAPPQNTVVTAADPRVRDAYVQLKLAQAFPTSFAEAFTPGQNWGIPNTTLQGWSAYSSYLGTLGITAANVATKSPGGAIETSVCAMMALERGPMNNNITPESLGTAQAKLQTVNGNGAFGLVDGWGTPLIFSRTNKLNQFGPQLKTVGKDGQPYSSDD